MSPLAVLYFLLASSPVWMNNDNNNKEWSTSSWERFPSTFGQDKSIFGGEHKNIFESLFNNKEWMTPEFSTESSIFGGRKSAEEPMTRLFSLLRKAIRPTTSTRRHFATELFGESPMTSSYESSSIESPIKLIKLLAKVNPILIEKLLTRPESRFALEKLIKKSIRSTPFSTEESLFNTESPITRRHAEVARLVKLIKLIKKSHSRRSIVAEIFPTTFDFDFESTESSSPIARHLIEKVIRHAEVARLVKKLIKKSILSTPFSTEESRFNVESPIARRHLVEKVLRNPIVLNKIIRRLVKKSNVFEREESSIVSSPVEELLSTLSHVEPKKIEKVIRRLVKAAVFEPEFETLSWENKWEKKSPMKKIVKSIVKNLKNKKTNVFGEEKEILCNACESVCERESFEFSKISSIKSIKKVCRVCENVCSMNSFFRPATVFGRHFDF